MSSACAEYLRHFRSEIPLSYIKYGSTFMSNFVAPAILTP